MVFYTLELGCRLNTYLGFVVLVFVLLKVILAIYFTIKTNAVIYSGDSYSKRLLFYEI